jgi:hypothetical protein
MLSVIMLSVIILSVIMLNAVKLSVVLLNDMAPVVGQFLPVTSILVQHLCARAERSGAM